VGTIEERSRNPNDREAGVGYGPRHPAGVEAAERRSEAFREAQTCLERHLRDGRDRCLPTVSALGAVPSHG
jgi:hypothetical protein